MKDRSTSFYQNGWNRNRSPRRIRLTITTPDDLTKPALLPLIPPCLIVINAVRAQESRTGVEPLKYWNWIPFPETWTRQEAARVANRPSMDYATLQHRVVHIASDTMSVTRGRTWLLSYYDSDSSHQSHLRIKSTRYTKYSKNASAALERREGFAKGTPRCVPLARDRLSQRHTLALIRGKLFKQHLQLRGEWNGIIL